MFAFKQNEKVIKHNQDIDKLEKEKLKEQWKRDELKEKKVLEFEQNRKYLEYVMNQKETEIWIDKIAQGRIESKISKRTRRILPNVVLE